MRIFWKRASIVGLFLSILATVGACRELSPEEKVELLRSRYTARINESGFFVRDILVEPAAVDADPGAVLEAEEEPADDGALAESVEPVEPETRQEILLDIIVQHDSNEALPGITLDLEMVDAQGDVKKHWRKWVETEGLPKANQKQVTETLVDVGYEEGDGFNVEIRSDISPEERTEYKEFAAATGG